MPHPTVYTGTFIHTPSLGSLEVLENAAVFVDGNGVIISIIENVSREELGKKIGEEGEGWVVFDGDGGKRGEGKGEGGEEEGRGGRWWCPGFVGEFF